MPAAAPNLHGGDARKRAPRDPERATETEKRVVPNRLAPRARRRVSRASAGYRGLVSRGQPCRARNVAQCAPPATTRTTTAQLGGTSRSKTTARTVLRASSKVNRSDGGAHLNCRRPGVDARALERIDSSAHAAPMRRSAAPTARSAPSVAADRRRCRYPGVRAYVRSRFSLARAPAWRRRGLGVRPRGGFGTILTSRHDFASADCAENA